MVLDDKEQDYFSPSRSKKTLPYGIIEWQHLHPGGSYTCNSCNIFRAGVNRWGGVGGDNSSGLTKNQTHCTQYRELAV